MFKEELDYALSEGAALMAIMIEQSVFTNKPVMPPPYIWQWYVEYATYTFCEEEREFARSGIKGTQKYVEDGAARIEAIGIILEKNKQLGLLETLRGNLALRKLSLPDSYVPNYTLKLEGGE